MNAVTVGISNPRAATSRRAPTAGGARLVRVAALGGSSLLLACGAHLAGGGRLPSVGVLSVVAIVLGLMSVMLTSRRCAMPTLLTALSVEQGLLHLLFQATSAAGQCGSLLQIAGGHAAEMGRVTSVCGPTSSAMGATTGMVGAANMGGWLMWVGHLTAILLTTWLLARGEAWLWKIADDVVAAASVAPSRRRPAQRRHAERLGP